MNLGEIIFSAQTDSSSNTWDSIAAQALNDSRIAVMGLFENTLQQTLQVLNHSKKDQQAVEQEFQAK